MQKVSEVNKIKKNLIVTMTCRPLNDDTKFEGINKLEKFFGTLKNSDHLVLKFKHVTAEKSAENLKEFDKQITDFTEKHKNTLYKAVIIYYHGIYYQEKDCTTFDVENGFLKESCAINSLKEDIPMISIIDGNICNKIPFEIFRSCHKILNDNECIIYTSQFGNKIDNTDCFAEELANVLEKKEFKTIEEMLFDKIGKKCEGKHGYSLNMDMYPKDVDVNTEFMNIIHDK